MAAPVDNDSFFDLYVEAAVDIFFFLFTGEDIHYEPEETEQTLGW